MPDERHRSRAPQAHQHTRPTVWLAASLIGIVTLAAVVHILGFDAPMVELGSAAGSGAMTIEDLTLDGTGAGTFASTLRSRLGALTLRRVAVVQTGGAAKQAPAIDADLAAESLTLDRVSVVANTQAADVAVGAVNAGGPTVVRDSHHHAHLGRRLRRRSTRGPLTVERSTIAHGDANLGYARAGRQPDVCTADRHRLLRAARRPQRRAVRPRGRGIAARAARRDVRARSPQHRLERRRAVERRRLARSRRPSTARS